MLVAKPQRGDAVWEREFQPRLLQRFIMPFVGATSNNDNTAVRLIVNALGEGDICR